MIWRETSLVLRIYMINWLSVSSQAKTKNQCTVSVSLWNTGATTTWNSLSRATSSSTPRMRTTSTNSTFSITTMPWLMCLFWSKTQPVSQVVSLIRTTRWIDGSWHADFSFSTRSVESGRMSTLVVRQSSCGTPKRWSLKWSSTWIMRRWFIRPIWGSTIGLEPHLTSSKTRLWLRLNSALTTSQALLNSGRMRWLSSTAFLLFLSW